MTRSPTSSWACSWPPASAVADHGGKYPGRVPGGDPAVLFPQASNRGGPAVPPPSGPGPGRHLLHQTNVPERDRKKGS